MDFQEARDRRGALAPGPEADRRVVMRKRAEDARLRRAIREALARQRAAPETAADPPREEPRLRVVRNAEQ